MQFVPKSRLYLSTPEPNTDVVEALAQAAERDTVKVLGAKCYEAALELVSRSAYSHFVQSAVLASLQDGEPPETHLQRTLEELQGQVQQFIQDAEVAVRYLKLRDAEPRPGERLQ